MSHGAAHGDELSAAVIVVLGLAALVVAVYAAVVLVLGRAPIEGERGLLVWSMVAAAIAVALAFPVRRRLSAIGRRVVLSDGGAADEAVRNFGSRASRSVPLDDLFLQAAESLRTSLGLVSAEFWVVAGDSLSLKDLRSGGSPRASPARERRYGRHDATGGLGPGLAACVAAGAAGRPGG